MNSSPAPSPTHEYRMKVSRSGLYLLLAALLMFCGVFMVATVVRSRLIIEGSQIRFRIVFREEVFPLSEIEGFRTISTGPASHRVSRRVICVKDRSEPIEIVQFDQDDFLQTWLQQLPNLDQPDQTGDQPDQTGSMNAKSVVILVFGCLRSSCWVPR